MELAPKTRLGPYEITSSLGAGGMGEVYRARDTRLDRDVAVKVLPAELAQNAQFKLRFEREAKTISSLNHPHICTLHDVGEENGISYLVMELVDGESLADRLAKGPLPIADVLTYGTQIAEALDRAHRAGVVHRDLKPGNVMITKSGAKLLDFGLAKSREAAVEMDGATVQKPLTQEGTILGTFQYMSPEQLEGQEADARTDIFALGAVLYEMATGRRAFEGKTKTSLIAAIVKEQPRPIAELQPLTPPALQHVVDKCLAKDADDRWQSAHDIAEELSWIREAGSQAGVAAPVVARKRWRERIAWILSGVFALSLGIGGALLIPKLRRATRPFVANIAPPREARFNAVGDYGGPIVLSPDGTLAVYSIADATGNRLMLRSLVTGETKELSGTGGAVFPFWSPDSRKIGFFTNTQLERVDISGGAPIPICPVSQARGGAWGAGDTIIFAPSTQDPISKVAATGGKPVAVTKLDTSQHTSHRWPEFLPDGKRFLYLACNHQDPAGSVNAVYLGFVDGAAPRMVLRSVSNAIYANGYLLFDRDQTLYAQKVKSDLSLDGEPIVIAQDALYDAGIWRGAFSVTQDGLLAYHSGRAAVLSHLSWLDRHGTVIGTAGDKAAYWDIDLSPDKRKLLLPIGDPQRDLWIQDLQRNTRTKVTLNGWADLGAWSPDGETVYVDVLRRGSFELVAKRITGGEMILDRRKSIIAPRCVTPDGKDLFLETSGVIERLSLDPPGKPVPITRPGVNAFGPTLSPNGKWLAYGSDENGRSEVFVVSLAHPGLKWQVSANGGEFPRWRGDGKEIYFVDPTRHITAAAVTEKGNDLEFGAPEVLFAADLRPGSRTYDVSSDGQKFLVSAIVDQDSPTVVILNDWHARLPH